MFITKKPDIEKMCQGFVQSYSTFSFKKETNISKLSQKQPVLKRKL